MRVRKLNDHGLGEFERYIRQLRDGKTVTDPTWILTDERTSSPVTLAANLESRLFATRFEMGAYLCEQFSEHNMQPYIGDRGFWSWIALLWFDQLCPKKAGQPIPAMHYNYVLSSDYRHRPRHAIYITWQLVDRYGEDARFLLCKEISTRGELIEQMMARQDILSLDGVMRLASHLYMDPVTGNFKKGAASRKSGGCVSRYIAWLQQLENTYDLFLATKNDLQALLPSEFQRFIKT